MSKKIVVIYSEITTGGSTTSLLPFLQFLVTLDADIDLLLMYASGEEKRYLPDKVNLLEPIFPQGKQYVENLWLGEEWSAVLRRGLSRIYAFLSGKRLARTQMVGQFLAQKAIAPNASYDVAISFLEGFPFYYLADRVIAHQKLAWIHTDYYAAGFLYQIDKASFSKVDNIVFVAEGCANDFSKRYPKENKKAIYVENFVDIEEIHAKSKQKLVDFHPPKDAIKFITVARIDFSSKALDRAVKVFSKLDKKNKLSHFIWYILGDGPDAQQLCDLVKIYSLSDKIVLLGHQSNPFPYISQCDVFFLPSRYEGMPMSVQEAQALNVVPCITQYTTASKQVQDGINGIILQNSEKGIYCGLLDLLDHPEKVNNLKSNISANLFKTKNCESEEEICNLLQLGL